MNPFSKGFREFFLTVGQDFTENNPIKQAYEGGRFLVRRVNGRKNETASSPPAHPTSPAPPLPTEAAASSGRYWFLPMLPQAPLLLAPLYRRRLRSP